MKLLFENWRKYLNEAESPTLSMQTQRLMQILINIKEFGSIENFLSRAEIVINTEDDLQFVMLIDGKVAATVVYSQIDASGACRPAPFEDKQTYMLVNVARDGSFKGYGVGRINTFLSACYINSKGGSITSDRNTSDQAGKQLVGSLKMLGMKQSNDFDYVGFFIDKLKRYYLEGDKKIDLDRYETDSPKSSIPVYGIYADYKHNKELKARIPELVKKVIDHLSPVATAPSNDDCSPSYNIKVFDEHKMNQIFISEDFPIFLEQILSNPPEKFKEILESDDRVQGFTFVLPEKIINAGVEIISAIDKTSNKTDMERLRISGAAHDLFDDVYNAEATVSGERQGS